MQHILDRIEERASDIAKVIAKQISSKTLYLLGAKNLMCGTGYYFNAHDRSDTNCFLRFNSYTRYVLILHTGIFLDRIIKEVIMKYRIIITIALAMSLGLEKANNDMNYVMGLNTQSNLNRASNVLPSSLPSNYSRTNTINLPGVRTGIDQARSNTDYQLINQRGLYARY
jgi:hypothetical protein